MRAMPASGISSVESNRRLIGAAVYSDSSARKCAASPAGGRSSSGSVADFVGGEQGDQRVA